MSGSLSAPVALKHFKEDSEEAWILRREFRLTPTLFVSAIPAASFQFPDCAA